MARTERKVYLVTLLLGMFSLVISALLITIILKDNQTLLVDPTQDMVQLEVLNNQKGILQFAAMIPTLLFIVNLVMVILVYRYDDVRKCKSFKLSLLWIVISLAYQILLFLDTSMSINLEIVVIPVMAVAWISKLLTFWYGQKELREERKALKGNVCVN